MHDESEANTCPRTSALVIFN